MIREAYIVIFGRDFVHRLFPTWGEAARVIVDNGHGVIQGNSYLFENDYDIERVTVH